MATQERPLTPAMEDYLRAMYDLSQYETPVHTTSLARHLDVAPASVTGMLKRLASLGLVYHERYGGAKLSPTGEQVAVQVMRHHRIIETFLSQAMGVSWDEVHLEAHRLEHHVSPQLGDRMDEMLGHPQRDPHGSPIPPRSGPFVIPRYTRLADAAPDAALVVREVLDEDGAHLRAMSDIGLLPDAELTVVSTSEDGPITIEVDGRRHALDRDLAVAVFVEPAV